MDTECAKQAVSFPATTPDWPGYVTVGKIPPTDEFVCHCWKKTRNFNRQLCHGHPTNHVTEVTPTTPLSTRIVSLNGKEETMSTKHNNDSRASAHGRPEAGVHIIIGYLHMRKHQVTKEHLRLLMRHSLSERTPKPKSLDERFYQKCVRGAEGTHLSTVVRPKSFGARGGSFVRFGPISEDDFTKSSGDREESDWNEIRRCLEDNFPSGGSFLMVKLLVEENEERHLMTWSESLDAGKSVQDGGPCPYKQASLLRYFGKYR